MDDGRNDHRGVAYFLQRYSFCRQMVTTREQEVAYDVPWFVDEPCIVRLAKLDAALESWWAE